MDVRTFDYYLPNDTASYSHNGAHALDSTREHFETHDNVVVIVGANGSGKSKLGAWMERQDPVHVHRIVSQRKLNPSEYTPLKSFQEAENVVRYGNERYQNKYAHKWSNGKTETTKLVDDFDAVLSGLLAERNNASAAFLEQS